MRNDNSGPSRLYGGCFVTSLSVSNKFEVMEPVVPEFSNAWKVPYDGLRSREGKG